MPFIFIYLKGREKERKGVLPFMNSLPIWLQQTRLGKPKPGARGSIWIFHVGDTGPNSRGITWCLPCTLAGN